MSGDEVKKEKRVRKRNMKTFIVTPYEGPQPQPKIGKRYSKPLSARALLLREVVREVSGYAPYEKRVMELLKTDTASSYKRSYKVLKKRLGSHTRAKKHREVLMGAIQSQKKH